MSTSSFATRLRHDTDAFYREWRDEFISTLNGLAGLAADETSITPGAGTRAAVNTEEGYAVYHLDDALHATSPLYIRLGFGTGASSGYPRLQVRVGQSTNGSGVLGGTALTSLRNAGSFSGVAPVDDVLRASRFSVEEGFFGFENKVTSQSSMTFLLSRSCDSDGTPNGNAAVVTWGSGISTTAPIRQCLRLLAPNIGNFAATTTHVEGALCFNPQMLSASLIGGEAQVFPAWMVTPEARPIFSIAGVYPGELGEGSTFSVAIVGTVARTYIRCSDIMGSIGVVAPATLGGLVHCMLWE